MKRKQNTSAALSDEPRTQHTKKPRETKEYKGKKTRTAQHDSTAQQIKKKRSKVDDFDRIAKQAKILTSKIQLKTNRKKDKEMRDKLVTELYALVKPRVNDFAMKHDTCRTIQCVYKFVDEEKKNFILKALEERFVELSKGKYSCFMILSFLKNGRDTQRLMVLKLLESKLLRNNLVSHANSAHVIDQAIKIDTKGDNKSIKSLKKRLFNEMFGERVKLLDESVQKQLLSPEHHLKLLESNSRETPLLMSPVDVNNFEAILKQLKKRVFKMIDKGLVRFYYVQKLIYHFLTCCQLCYKTKEIPVEGEENNAGEKEGVDGTDEIKDHVEDLKEMIDYVLDPLLLMFGSSFGVKSLMKLIAHSTAKQKKKMLRKLQTISSDSATQPASSDSILVNSVTHIYGYLVVCALMQCTDDVVLLKKVIFKELARLDSETLIRLLFNEQSSDSPSSEPQPQETTEFLKFCSLYLNAPNQKRLLRIFYKENFLLMQPRNETAKKDAEKKYAELKQDNSFNDSLLELLLQSFDTQDSSVLFERKNGAQFISDVICALQTLTSDEVIEKVVQLKRKILGLLSDSGKVDLLTNDATHFAVVRVINEETRLKQKLLEGKDDASEAHRLSLIFCSEVWEQLQGKGRLKQLLSSNRGCFVLVNLLDDTDLHTIMKREISKALKLLKQKKGEDKSPGMKLLAEKLSS